MTYWMRIFNAALHNHVFMYVVCLQCSVVSTPPRACPFPPLVRFKRWYVACTSLAPSAPFHSLHFRLCIRDSCVVVPFLCNAIIFLLSSSTFCASSPSLCFLHAPYIHNLGTPHACTPSIESTTRHSSPTVIRGSPFLASNRLPTVTQVRRHTASTRRGN